MTIGREKSDRLERLLKYNRVKTSHSWANPYDRLTPWGKYVLGILMKGLFDGEDLADEQVDPSKTPRKEE
jgi:hypothetical protein